MPANLDPLEVFGPALKGNLKTYVTAGVGLLTMFLSGFGIWDLNQRQMTALTGAFILVAFIFQRLAVWKAQKAAAAASTAAAKTLAAVADLPQMPAAVPRARKPRKKMPIAAARDHDG